MLVRRLLVCIYYHIRNWLSVCLKQAGAKRKDTKTLYMVGVVQLARTPDCGSGGRRFESGHPPQPCPQEL